MDRPPVSVLLPTIRWTDACDEVAGQLREDDELLVVCDDANDPVAERRGDHQDGSRGVLPSGVRIVLAGEPAGCSGKANAIAAGMEAAAHERVVWTDDDFHHPPDWLDTLAADYDRQGPTTEIPVFVGEDPLATLLEPPYLIGGSLAVAHAGVAWGGAVVFERGDLDEAAFLRDLRRSLSDDGELTEHLDEVTAARRTRTVPCGGSIRESLERFVRFVAITRQYAPLATAGNVVLAVVLAAVCLVAPVVGGALVMGIAAAAYASLGVRRPSFLLAVPAVLAGPPLLAYAFARRSFVWAGRRYRWRGRHDVTVLSE
ncbi:hypothetical protein JCM17823_27430 [Halorubrum gandharaense]